MKSQFVLAITETGRENLKVPPQSFNLILKEFETKEKLKEYLIERYGKIPKGRKKIYRDRENTMGLVTDEVGFLHSFWSQDISHNSKKWYQTDWIEFYIEKKKRTYFKL